jgi:hypothetical protein
MTHVIDVTSDIRHLGRLCEKQATNSSGIAQLTAVSLISIANERVDIQRALPSASIRMSRRATTSVCEPPPMVDSPANTEVLQGSPRLPHCIIRYNLSGIVNRSLDILTLNFLFD